MKIALDIDNVCCNTTEEVLRFINERLPTLNLQIEDLTQYMIERALPQEYQWIVEMAFRSPEMWKKVKLLDNCAAAINFLYSSGHEIYFATATTADNFRKKIKFLERELSFLPQGYVRHRAISIKEKQLLNVDFLVDDYLGNLTGRRGYTSICMAYPWNLECPEDIYRVHGWKECVRLFEELIP